MVEHAVPRPRAARGGQAVPGASGGESCLPPLPLLHSASVSCAMSRLDARRVLEWGIREVLVSYRTRRSLITRLDDRGSLGHKISRWRKALMQTLNRARELYRQRSQASPSVDELASLLAQCAIADAQSSNTNAPQAPGSDPVMMLDSDEACILSECGRKQTILDAFADGSSFICLKCGGLFSTSRKDEHLAYWCGTA